MSSVRVPGSLRRPVTIKPAPAAGGRLEVSKTSLFTAACLAAASPASIVLAQTAPQQPLPPLSVEAKQPKKKAPAKKPSGAAAAPAAAPQVAPEQKSANPYASPDAPYKVEQSGSSKLTEPLVNTPKTITAIPKEVIEDKGATSLRDLARQTPGVTIGFAEGGSAFGDSVYIRGFQARNDIFVDGLRDPGNTSREVFAVEQIEVYKGPGSSVSGRATPGGAINIITKKPNFENNFFNVSTMVGTDHTIRTTADVNQVLSPSLAVRGNVMYHQNEVAGRDFAEDERWGGQLAVTYKPTDAFKLTIDYYRLRTDGIPDWGVPINRNTTVPWTESGVPRDTWYGNINRDFIKNQADAVTATVEAKLAPNVKLTSRTRYSHNVADYIASLPQHDINNNLATPIDIGNPQRYQEVDSIAHLSDLTFKFHTGPWLHTMVAGVEVSRDDFTRYTYGGFAAPPVHPDGYPLIPNPDRPVGNITKTWSYDARIDTKAAYLLDTVKLSEQWYLNGGIRVDNFQRKQAGSAVTNTTEREDTLFNWHAGIVYKPIPIASVYLAYATATSPVGTDLDSTGANYNGLSAGSAVLDPEETKGVEIGTKWELFNRRLLATAALFQSEKSNARENAASCNNTTLECALATTGAYRIRGVDLSVQGKVTERWSVYGGLVVVDTEVTKSGDPALLGRRMANVPTTQFSLLSKYRLTDKLTIGGQAIYSSEIYAGRFAAATYNHHIVPFWRFDALAEYKLTDNVSLQLNVINLTDELYYDSLYQSINGNAFVAPGRTGYLTVNFKY
jgi:catecholate siderophore receptor